MGISIGKCEVTEPRSLNFMVQPVALDPCYGAKPERLNQSSDLYKTSAIQC